MRVPEYVHVLFLPAYSLKSHPGEPIWHLTDRALLNLFDADVDGEGVPHGKLASDLYLCAARALGEKSAVTAHEGALGPGHLDHHQQETLVLSPERT
jgi:hypothetical protein